MGGVKTCGVFQMIFQKYEKKPCSTKRIQVSEKMSGSEITPHPLTRAFGRPGSILPHLAELVLVHMAVDIQGRRDIPLVAQSVPMTVFD